MEKMAHRISLRSSGHGWLTMLKTAWSTFLKWVISNKLLVGILLLASFLRLYKISDYMTFLGDEGRDVLIVKGILEGDFTLLGPRASAGDFFTGPIYYYFMAPFLWLFRLDPVGPAVMIAILGIVTVFLVYFLGKRVFGQNAGLVAAFLYTISPLVISYSRSSWNPNPMPFFSLVFLLVLYKALKQGKKVLFFVLGILYGVMLQLHYIELFMGVIFFTIILFYQILYDRSKIFVRLFVRYGLIFLGFLVGFSPFLAFEIRHGFPNLQTIFRFVLNQESTGNTIDRPFYIGIPDVFQRLFGRLLTGFPPPEQFVFYDQTLLTVWYWGTIALGIASFVMIFTIKDKLFRLMLLCWLIIGVFLFGFYQKAIYDYYFEFLFPLPFLLVGGLLKTIRMSVMLFTFAVYLLLALVVYQLKIPFFTEHTMFIYLLLVPILIVLNLRPFKNIKIYSVSLLVSVVFLGLVVLNLKGYPFQHTPNKQKDQVRKISEFVLDKTNGEPFNFALVTQGNSDHGYRYFFNINGRDPVTIENLQLDPERNSVTDQLLIVCEFTDCQPLGYSLWEVAGFGRAEIENSWDVSVVKVFKLRKFEEN